MSPTMENPGRSFLIHRLLILVLGVGCAVLIYDDLSLREEKKELTRELLRHEMQSRRGEKRGDRHRNKSKSHFQKSDLDERDLSGLTKSELEKPTSLLQTSGAQLRIVEGQSEDPKAEIEQKAEARAHEMVDEWRASRQSRREERIRQTVSNFADERDWESSLTENVMELVFNSVDERRALREEFRAEETPREERYEKMKAIRESYQGKLAEMMSPDDANDLGDLLKPPHARQSK